MTIEAARKDYELFLKELGITDETVRQRMQESPFNNDVMRLKSAGIVVKPSPIQGNGLFTAYPRAKGFQLITAQRTTRFAPGVWSNHSNTANTTVAASGNFMLIILNRDLKAGEEITTNYREVHKLVTGQ